MLMLTIDKINELFGITESFHAPYKLNEILKDKQQREDMFEQFLQEESDLSFDWFTEYFQAEQSDRKNMKQDYSPNGIVTLTSELLGSTNSNADLCAGTGGLTIKRWSTNKDADFWCEEYSDRAMPFLLFNLAIRNINAIVCHGDTLTREFKAVYQLKRSDKFSSIKLMDKAPSYQYDTVIMNPPYSLKYDPSKSNLTGTLPLKSKADYAFVKEGLLKLNEVGKMAVILPHGVLFRSASEAKIRQELIEQGLLDAVIGLPAKAFMNTDIPTVILIFSKQKAHKDIFFIDAKDEYEPQKPHNILTKQNISKILKTYKDRRDVGKLAHVTTLSEIQDNDYNLNIPRYVDTFEEEPVEPLADIVEQIKATDAEIAKAENELGGMLDELIDQDLEEQKVLKELAGMLMHDKPVTIQAKERKPKPQSKGEQLSLL